MGERVSSTIQGRSAVWTVCRWASTQHKGVGEVVQHRNSRAGVLLQRGSALKKEMLKIQH